MDARAGFHHQGRRPEDGSASRTAGGDRRRVTATQIALVVLVAVLVGVGVGYGSHLLLANHSATPAAATNSGLRLDGEATWATGARPAPVIDTLRDQNGRVFSLASLRGHTVAIEFFDSHCKQACPLAGRALAAADRSLPRAQRPILVVVSVNPLDTPASTRAAIRAWNLQGAAPWYWLMGTHSELAPVWSAYHVVVVPEKGDIEHTEALYLLDRRGYERSGYLYPYIPVRVAHDMRILASANASRAADNA